MCTSAASPSDNWMGGDLECTVRTSTRTEAAVGEKALDAEK